MGRRRRNQRRVLGPAYLVLGAAIRETRARRGLSQEELGGRCGMHRNYIGALERGEVNPTFRTLSTVCAGLDYSLPDLMQLYVARQRDRDERGRP